MALLETGTKQKELLWTYCGRECSSTPDVFTSARVADLKTSVSANPPKFVRDALRLGYHAQLAFYGEALRTLKLANPIDHYLVCVESSAPYPVVIYELSPRALDFGMRLCRTWMERLLVCEAEDFWPGYSEATVLLDVPDDDFSFLVSGDADELVEQVA
jgi:hypothetical protein